MRAGPSDSLPSPIRVLGFVDPIADLLRAADVILPDTYQCSGILGVKKVAVLCEAAGVPCVFHCSHDLSRRLKE